MYAVTLLQKGVARAEALERASRYAKHLLLPDAAAEAFWNGAYDLYEEGVS
jgi:hypothetical protein